MKEEIIQTFQDKIFTLNKNDPTYKARKEYYENKMEEELDSVESFAKSKNKRKRNFKNVDEKIAESLDPTKAKMVFEFNNYEAASIKSIAVKKMKQHKSNNSFYAWKITCVCETFFEEFYL